MSEKTYIRCMGPYPACGHHNQPCTANPEYLANRPKPPTPPGVYLQVYIPGELVDIKPDLQRFFDAMIYKLRRNSKKGKWEDLTIDRCIELLNGEVAELVEATKERSTAEVVFEAADVANFAMMAASISLMRIK